MQLPIEDHGIIGDLSTVALVGLDGTIDYLCWPRFDSPSVFAALLDDDRGGRFSLGPELDGARHRQLYLPDTNVLLTRFLSPDGVAEVSDFMALGAGEDGSGAVPGQTASGQPSTENPVPRRLVRRAKSVRGTIRFRMRCAPAFDYARAGFEARAEEDSVVLASSGEDGTRLRLTSDAPLEIDEEGVTATFELAHGESCWFVLSEADDRCTADCVATSFKATSDYWRGWVALGSYRGRWRDMVNRSALVLKLLTSAEHGSMVAAATFGLPEEIGGERNWDYRFTWIRDAAFTVYGLIRVGHVAEADAFMGWLAERAQRPHADGTLGVMYRLDGGEDLEEISLDHLSGYRDSRPVRIGNGASDQLQLDIYGELMDAVYLADKYGTHTSHESWRGLKRSLEWLVDHWREPDEGIWEVRSGRQELLYSRLMCWVAFDRGLRLADKRSLPAPRERWLAARDAIHEEIHERFWSEERGAFVQSAVSAEEPAPPLDASCLLMPLVRFIGPKDPRWLATLDRIGDELTDDSLVYRYSLEAEEAGADGLEGVEGTFNMCSFWYVECLARAGRIEQARFLFEKMLGYANHLGLFAEETGATGEQLGNFPQAFTHLALISAAYALDREIDGGGNPG